MLEEEHGTKNHWYHHVSGAGSEHVALPRAVAIADKTFVSIFLFILHAIDANHLSSTGRAQGLAFKIINRNCHSIFSLSFFFFSSFLFVLKVPSR